MTNGDGSGATHRVSRFPELEGRFQAVVVHGAVGLPAKPDPAPFQACHEKLGVQADSAVYVGDDWGHDVCGAARAGLRPIWIRHGDIPRNWPAQRTSIPVVTSLRSLLDLTAVLQSAP